MKIGKLKSRKRGAMIRSRVLILIAMCVVLSSFTSTSVRASNLEQNSGVHKEKILARRVSQQRSKKRGVQQDIDLLQMRLDAHNKMITDQSKRITDIAVTAKRYSLVTIILLFIIGISSWFVSGRKAEMSAKKWMDEHAVDLRKEIESLREALHHQSGKMQRDVDSATEETMHIIQESIAAGKKPDISDDARRVLQTESEYLKMVPENQYRAQDWAKLAFAAYAENKPSHSIEYFKSAVGAGDAGKSEQAEWLLSIASILDATKHHEEAIAIFDEVVRRFSEEKSLGEQVAKALVKKGVRLGQLQRSEEAIAVYNEVIGRFGSSDEIALQEQVAKTQFNKGVRLGQLQRHEEAIEVYNEVISRFGSSKDAVLQEQVEKALFNKGTILGELHRNEEAVAVYDELINRFGSSKETALQEKTAMALVNKGTTLGQLHRNEESIAVYDEVIKRFGSSKEAALQKQVAKALSNKEARTGQLQESQETNPVSDKEIKRSVSSNERGIQEQIEKALFNKGGKLEQTQRSEEAVPVSDEAINRFDSSMDAVLQEQAATALNSKGSRLLIKAKQNWDNETEREKLLRNALVCFDESLRRKNDYSISLGNKGYVLFLMNRTDDAKEALRTALQTGRENLRNAELENAALSTVPEDTAFRELMARLCDELNIH
jgi:tetratricopeptide (TPR) repeat protein